MLIGVYAIFATINILGVERGSRLNNALTAAKILPLLLLIVGGVFAIDSRNLAIVNPPDLPTLARSSILLIFVFAGVEAALVPSGEVKDPNRTVPRAIVMAMVTITVIYASLQFVAQGVLGPALATAKAAPLAEAAGVALGGWARQLLLIGAVVSMVGHVGGMILATPRMLFAFARDGFFPPQLARVHAVYRTPAAAILLQCALVLVLAITSTFERLAILANLSTSDSLRHVLRRNLGAPAPRRARRRRTVQGAGAESGCRPGAAHHRLDADERHARRMGRVRRGVGCTVGDFARAPGARRESRWHDVGLSRDSASIGLQSAVISSECSCL